MDVFCQLPPPSGLQVSPFDVAILIVGGSGAGGLNCTILHGPDHLADNAPDVPFFLYGDQHHTRIPRGSFDPNGDGVM